MVFNLREIVLLCHRLTIYFFVWKQLIEKSTVWFHYIYKCMSISIFNNGNRFDDVIAWNEMYPSKWWEIKMWWVAWEKHKNCSVDEEARVRRGEILNHQHDWRQWRTKKKIQSHVLILFDSANLLRSLIRYVRSHLTPKLYQPNHGITQHR